MSWHDVESAARRAAGCTKCGHLACVCKTLNDHVEGCQFRLASTCTVPIECPHGLDTCPICDPCTCFRVGAHD